MVSHGFYQWSAQSNNRSPMISHWTTSTCLFWVYQSLLLQQLNLFLAMTHQLSSITWWVDCFFNLWITPVFIIFLINSGFWCSNNFWHRSFESWSRLPVKKRIQCLLRIESNMGQPQPDGQTVWLHCQKVQILRCRHEGRWLQRYGPGSRGRTRALGHHSARMCSQSIRNGFEPGSMENSVQSIQSM